MKGYTMPGSDVRYLDQALLGTNGELRVMPFSFYKALPALHIQQWGNERGVYVFPTQELIDWLRNHVSGRRAIEICSGHGAIGKALGIACTDSYMQTWPEMRAYYLMLRQCPIEPPSHVLRYEANESVDALKPEVVIAAFATQKYQTGDESDVGSSLYGVDELSLLRKIKRYIFIGNDSPHGDKRIWKLPHETFRFEWLVTRAMKPELNHIKVWNTP